MAMRSMVGGLLCGILAASAAWADGNDGKGHDHSPKQCCPGVTLTPIPAGDQCANGGVQITSGCCDGDHHDGDQHGCTPQTAVVCNGQNATNAAYTASYQQGEAIPLGTTPTTILTLSVPPGSYVVKAKTVISGDDQATNHDVVCQLFTSIQELDASVITPDHEVMEELLGSFTTTVPEQIVFDCYQTYVGNKTPMAEFFQIAAQQVNPLVQEP